MDQTIVYSKTGKGVLEIKNKAGKLSRELAKVLSLVDGKSAVADIIAKSKLSDANLARCLTQLEEGGYIKEFTSLSLSGARSSSSASGPTTGTYVDDLDFTSTLAPGRRVYSNAAADFRDHESADRVRAETEATRKRQASEEQKKDQAKQQAQQEAVRMARIEAERKSKEAAAIKARQQAELNEKRQAVEMAKTTRDLAKILEVERQALDKSDSKKGEEQARKSKEDAERKAREQAEQAKREDAERRKREDDERRRREEEERKREQDAQKRREEEERKREEQERKRREEEERKREEEERKRREEEKRRREEEERKRREEEERKREEEERKRREEEDRRREEEDRRRSEAEDRRRREEEEVRRRDEEDDTRRRDEEERQQREESEVAAPSFDLDSFNNFDLPSAPASTERPAASFDLPSVTPDSGGSVAADFDRQQEMLRKQADEDEILRIEAEAAQFALEKAQRQEDARIESERRAEVEVEMRARVDQEKAERAAREQEKREAYEHKVRAAEDHKKHEAEKKQQAEQARIDAERKKREEELTRRRKGTEEEDRRRRELKALQKSGKVRSPLDSLKPVAAALVAVIALVVGAIHVIPMTGFIPKVEKIASDNIGEPVTIGSMKVSMLSGLQFKFTNVNVGSTQDVSLNDVTVSPQIGSLLGDKLIVKSIRADGGKIVKEALLRLPSWRNSSASDQRMQVSSIELRGISLEMRTFELPNMNADLQMDRNGSVIFAQVATTDGKVVARVTPDDGRINVSLSATNWTPPIGSPMEFADFTAKGVATASALKLSHLDATVYGGQAKGSAEISWESGWRASSQFEFERVATDELLAVFTNTSKVSGSASGKGSLIAQSGSLETLLDTPTLQASFIVRKGTLDGVDLVRALQAGSAGTQGGSTKFEELKGEVTISNGQFSYKNVGLSAGILSANGYFNIGSGQNVSGRVSVALNSSAQRLNANLNVTGNISGVLLRP